MKMFMNKNSIHIFLIIFFSCFNSFSQINPDSLSNNFLPLHTGNQWQYIQHESNDSNIEYYSLYYKSVSKDTLIENSRYYWYNSEWVRYIDSLNILNIRWDDSDRVFMNFVLNPQDTLHQFTFNNHLYRNVMIVDDYDYLFSNNYYLKGYRYVNMSAWETTWEFYAENFGPANYSYSQSIGPNYSLNRYVIMSLQYDSTGNPTYYSEHYKPEFSIIPILFIDTIFFKLDFFVQHEYSHFSPPGYPHQGLNFIDTVWMYRYYSNGDSIINISNLLAYNNPSYATSAYHVNFQLDTLLMKNGFNFYYRFLAKDKGIIPEYNWSPDSGYYECIWDDLVNLEERLDHLVTYHLSQNYPNPFNPTTNIEFRIAEFGLVSLKVYDMLGREVATLTNEEKPAGEYRVVFDGSDLTSGIYLYRIEITGKGNIPVYSETKKMMFLK